MSARHIDRIVKWFLFKTSIKRLKAFLFITSVFLVSFLQLTSFFSALVQVSAAAVQLKLHFPVSIAHRACTVNKNGHESSQSEFEWTAHYTSRYTAQRICKPCKPTHTAIHSHNHTSLKSVCCAERAWRTAVVPRTGASTFVTTDRKLPSLWLSGNRQPGSVCNRRNTATSEQKRTMRTWNQDCSKVKEAI